MKFLKVFLDSQEKHFTKDGKLEKLYPLYEMTHTILFSTTTTTKNGPHVRDNLDTKRYMILVVMSLLPCTLFGIFNAGYQAHKVSQLPLDFIPVFITGLKAFMPLVIVSYAIGGLWEVIFAIIRKHEINEGFLVTGILFPLTLPPTMPLWMTALGISFGIVIGKEIFGGTGRNFLNPALTGRAFIYFAYPAYISGEKVWNTASTWIDGFSGATPLGVAALVQQPNTVEHAIQSAGYSVWDMIIGFIPGSLGETSVICALIGAVILIATKIGSWRTMLGCVLGCLSMGYIFNLFATPETIPFLAMNPLYHLILGGFAFGAVFMATDPVSSPALESSRFIYGLCIGALTVIIRAINPAYPEGIMLAILLMNIFAPLIDHIILQSRLKKRIPNVI